MSGNRGGGRKLWRGAGIGHQVGAGREGPANRKILFFEINTISIHMIYVFDFCLALDFTAFHTCF